MRIFRIAFLALALLQGCAPLAPAGAPSNAGIVLATVTLAEPDDKGNWLPRRSLSAVFPAVQGAIFGKPSAELVASIPVLIGRAFTIDLAAWEQRFAQRAQAASGPTFKNVTLEPRAMRMARVGTFLFDTASQRYMPGGVGFEDADSGDHVLLVYVDRPCSMRGVMGEGDDSAEIDVSFPRAGLSWLRVVRNEATAPIRFRVSMAGDLKKLTLLVKKPAVARPGRELA